MNRFVTRSFETLDFRDPRSFLVGLRELELQVARTQTPTKIRTLRTNSLKEWRELREAAMFCYLMGQRVGQTIYVGPGERQDYDFVAMREDDGARSYTPVQLKEVVPKHVNPAATLEQVVASLAKYGDSRDLLVVIHLNQRLRFDPSDVCVPKLPIGGLWMFGAISPDQTRWGLWGDFLGTPTGTEHQHP